ncbi:MAG: hypothetical protein ABSH22_13255 [Tepidisphaeraceae bacterium]
MISRFGVSRGWLYSSLAISILAWALFLVALALHRTPNPIFWIFAAGWPVNYAITLAIFEGAVSAIGRPTSLTMKTFISPPAELTLMLRRFFAIAIPAALIGISLLGLMMGVVMLCAALQK